MFSSATFEITPMEKLIEIARDRGHTDTSRLTARCASCDAPLLANLGIAHEPDCLDPKHIEFKLLGSMTDRVRRKFSPRR